MSSMWIYGICKYQDVMCLSKENGLRVEPEMIAADSIKEFLNGNKSSRFPLYNNERAVLLVDSTGKDICKLTENNIAKLNKLSYNFKQLSRSRRMMIYEIGNDEASHSFVLTPNQPLLMANGVYKEVDEIVIGEQLFTYGNSYNNIRLLSKKELFNYNSVYNIDMTDVNIKNAGIVLTYGIIAKTCSKKGN